MLCILNLACPCTRIARAKSPELRNGRVRWSGGGHPFLEWWGVATLAVTSSTCYILNKYTRWRMRQWCTRLHTPGPTCVCKRTRVPGARIHTDAIDVRRTGKRGECRGGSVMRNLWPTTPVSFRSRGCSKRGLADQYLSLLNKEMICPRFLNFCFLFLFFCGKFDTIDHYESWMLKMWEFSHLYRWISLD